MLRRSPGVRREIEVNERMQELVPDIRGSDKLAAGLLIECRGQSAEALQVRRHMRIVVASSCRASSLVTVCLVQGSPVR